MANEIKDLKGFMDAADNEAMYLLNMGEFQYPTDAKDETRLQAIYRLMKGFISEADYIKQWGEHDTD